MYILIVFKASRGSVALMWNYKRDWLWVRFLLDEMKYLMFTTVSSLQGGVNFRHSTANASRIQ